MKTERDTRLLEVGAGILAQTGTRFREYFGEAEPILVADENTFAAAGEAVARSFHRPPASYIFSADGLYAEEGFVARLEEALRGSEAIPIAVGSGTINDLTKLAAHRAGRSYACVATAASMDGYTAFGASITSNGSKQTFGCPAPAMVVADLEVIRRAPGKMNAWGYADLMTKVTAGADWILADALGVEPIHQEAWDLVQGGLRNRLAHPGGIRTGDLGAIENLTQGLMSAGFAMQAMGSSRPASGAEHQFSHLWDMQHHTHEGAAPSHGFKVGIATLAVARIYDYLLARPFPDPEEAASRWPEKHEYLERVNGLLESGEFAEHAVKEALAKYLDREGVLRQLRLLSDIWPDLRAKLCGQLIPSVELKGMLEAVGAPADPRQIGISWGRLRASARQACYIRRRFTILDIVDRAGLWERADLWSEVCAF